MSNAGLPNTFWANAKNTAAYLINGCPSTAIELATSEEKWTGRPPHYDHLRVFGCIAYDHVKQGKLDPRSQ